MHAIVRVPDSDGYWWMNDPHAYGWEPVRVKTWPSGERVVYRTGVHNAEEIPTWCVEWVKLDEPNPALRRGEAVASDSVVGAESKGGVA